MIGSFVLDWAIIAVSLFNTILLLWLGLTLLQNAERRSSGVWLASGGLLTGAVFFISHTAILGHGLTYSDAWIDFWWHLGLVAVIVLPFAWYVVILWYAGYWENAQSRFHRRQRPWLTLFTLFAVGQIGLLFFANSVPSYTQAVILSVARIPTTSDIPPLMLIYPLYTLLNIVLSLHALHRPGPSKRIMGDVARQRARPWLVATSIILLLVGMLVIWAILWIGGYINVPYARGFTGDWLRIVAAFDLSVALLVSISVVLLGQAVVHYEVFTGKTLPRRGFMRHWRNAVILAAGYGLTMGLGLTVRLHPIYSLLLTAILMTVLYALFSWRSYTERERYIGQLRPFVTSQHLYDQLVAGAAPPDLDVSVPFQALCKNVLGSQIAYLVALGPLAPLVGPPLAYPSLRSVFIPSLGDLAAQFTSPQTMCVPIKHADALWAVPLWSERGLIGVLLLGEKHDGGLYTQEEIEIARATGERLIDTKASAEIARRLMGLQRQRMAESQVVDRRTRRVLHDEVLPQLHTAMLTLSNQPNPVIIEAVKLLADAHRQIADLLHEMPQKVAPERSGLVAALRRLLDEEFGNAFENVAWQIDPRAEAEAQAIPLLTAEVLYYAAREAIRNATRHGRGDDTDRDLHLRVAMRWRDGLEIVIADNGVGLQETPHESNGGGHGLALHSTLMAVIGGSLITESVSGKYTRVILALPREAWYTLANSAPTAESVR